MPSSSLQQWSTVRTNALDEIENAHGLIGGTGPGRRYATQQVNQAYAMLLSSQFQGFCRDLHSECVDYLVSPVDVTNPDLATILRLEFVFSRKLDHGNPTPANIGSDFNRLGLEFWNVVKNQNTHNKNRRLALEQMNRWRNAIAHQDFDAAELGGRTTLQIRDVRTWRAACAGLIQSFDAVMAAHLNSMTGNIPW